MTKWVYGDTEDFLGTGVGGEILVKDIDNRIQHVLERKLRPINWQEGMVFHEWTVFNGEPKAIVEDKDGRVRLLDIDRVVFEDK